MWGKLSRSNSAASVTGAVLLSAGLAWGAYYADLIGLIVLIIVVTSARRDRADAVKPASAEEPVPKPTGIEAALALLRAQARPQDNRSRRSLILLIMAVVCGAGVILESAYLLLYYESACGASYLETYMHGPRILTDVRSCVWLARDTVLSTAVVTPFVFATALCALLEYRSKSKRVWFKLPWFGLVAFLSLGPMPWYANAVSMAILLAIGAGIFVVIHTRMRPAGAKGARLDLPYRKIGVVSFVTVVAAVGVGAAYYLQNVAQCREAGKRTLDPRVEQKENVLHAVPRKDRQAIERAALTFFLGHAFDNAAGSASAVRLVKVDKVVLQGDRGMGLFTFDDGARTVRTVGVILKEAGVWKVERVSSRDGLFQPLPYPSEASAFIGHSGSPREYAGAGISRVESVDGCGAVMDRDVPSDGNVLVVYKGAGHIRSFEGSKLVSATSTVDVPAMGKFAPLDASSLKVAGDFTSALLKQGWQEAVAFAGGEQKEDLVRSFGSLVTGSYKLAGSPRQVTYGSYPYYLFPLRGPDGPETLMLQMADAGDGWQVVSLQLDADSPLNEKGGLTRSGSLTL
jgi:hypothetical protein